MLLAKIARKIHILFNMSNFDLEKEKEDRARNLYQTYVSNFSSNLIFGSGEEEPIGKEYIFRGICLLKLSNIFLLT